MRSIPSLVLLLGSWLAVAPTSASAAPQDIILMLDNSGSMRQNDPQFLTAVAVRRFLEQITGDARVAVLAFDQDVRWVVPLTPLDEGSRSTFLESLDQIDYSGQFTDSPKAMERAIYELNVNGRVSADKSIVFMTDGIVDTGDPARDLDKARWMQEDLAADAADGEIRIFGIAFTENADFQIIQALSRRTNGDYYRAFSAVDIDGVFARIIESLEQSDLAEIELEESELELEEESELAQFDIAAEVEEEAEAEAEAELGLDALESEAESLLPVLPELEPADAVSESETAPELPPLESEEESALEPTLAEETAAETGVADESSEVAAEVDSAAETPEFGETVDAGASQGPAPPVATGLSRQSLLIASVGAVVAVMVLGAVLIVMLRRRKAVEPEKYIPKAFLNDIAGVTEKPSYELDNTLTIVGRMRGPETESATYIVIEETTIGRNHAMIEFKDHSFWVVDQSSLNGTFVNGERIDGERRLKHGDRLRFHKHEFEFVMLEMFESDRTMMSDTKFAEISAELETEDDVTQPRSGATTTAVPGGG